MDIDPVDATSGRLSDVPLVEPEGEARSGRPIDHRTDLYALGCVLYHLFAGRPVFALEDAVALRHAHLAKLPDPLHEVADVPQILSNIVASLLKKQPEDRYQRAKDLLVDLETCLEDLRGIGSIRPFPLRPRARASAMAAGDFIYGRDSQIRQLTNVLAAARAGRPQRLLVTGAPGVGKSALCRHFVGRLKGDDLHAAIGKFEQFHSNTPYLGIIHGLESLADKLLGEPPGVAGALARNLAGKPIESLAALRSLIPVLDNLVGIALPEESLGGFGARDRLARSVLIFLAAVATPEQPVVLFLDDLQWADSASLDLLGRISDELAGCVMLVGLCRVERDAPDLLARAVAALSSKGTPPLRADLIALTRSDVEDLLLDIFGPKQHQLEAASLIYGKTLGSPLFINHFLSGLGDKSLLDPEAAWDIAAIAACEGAADVVDFLSARMISLDNLSRRVLATGACFGMSFQVDELADLTGLEGQVLARRLSSLIAEGFLVRIAEGCLFVHDRVREAAYRMAEDRHAIHRTIARRLLAATGGPEAHAFAIARHLNAAGDFSSDVDLTRGYLLASHLAARRAHAAAAFDLAHAHAEVALDCSRIDQWAVDRETMAATLLIRADSRVILLEHEAFDRDYERDLGHLRCAEDRLRLALTRVMSLDARSHFENALFDGLGALRSAGFDVPEDADRRREALRGEFAAFQQAIAGRPPEQLIALPLLEEPRVAIAMQILFRLAPSAHNMMQPELYALMAVLNMNLMLRHGRDALASGITMTLAVALTGLTRDITFSERFARVAMEMDPREGRRTPASVSFVYTYFFSHWLNPFEASLPSNLDGMRTAFEMGDIQFGCFHAAAYVMHLAAAGAPLRDLVRAGREHDRLIAGRVRVTSFHCGIEVAFAEALQGMTAAPTCFLRDRVTTVADVVSEADELAHHTERGFFLCRHLQLAYYFRDFAAAWVYAEAVTVALPAMEHNSVAVDVITFSLLTALATGHHRSDRFEEELARLRGWSALNPANFSCRLDLVRAELARCNGCSAEAIGLYVQAIADARRHRLVNLAALASEHAGRFFLSLGDEAAGRAHIREALVHYDEWGARAKVSALVDEFTSDLDKPAIGPVLDGRSTAVDFDSVLSAARSISAEIDLHPLLQKIMTRVQEVSGATYGALVLERDAGFFVEAVSRHGEGVTLYDADAHRADGSPLVPPAIVARVERDRTILVVNNASCSEFARDAYIRTHAVVSVLCVPLVDRGKLDGFIYLENNLTAGAFDPRSAQVLQVLAAQGAVALANARLFALLTGARAELASANEDLERRIEARTNELAMARNIALEKAAEAGRASQAARTANEAKSRFLSIVSHEIRTPMNGILGMLQLLDRGCLDGQQRRQIDLAQQSGLALVKLIDGILDYSRLELGAASANQEDFGIPGLVDASVEIFRPVAEAKGVRLDVDIEVPADVVLRGDAGGISRVIMNLVGNAVKFTAEGAVSVAIALLEQPASDSAILRLAVGDTGIGISAEMQSRIFEDFVQADASIARRYGGTGLGLAISHRIVSLLDGTLTVASEPGAGSVFEARIPVSIGSGAVTLATPIVSSEPLSLLVVDDDAINREVATGLLERLGHAVACADGCEAAILAVGCCAFDAVILDLHMPGLDGIETARRIRLSCGTAACPPIILLTADVTEASRQRCRDAGITRVLTKPLRLEALVNVLLGLDSDEGAASPPMSPNAAIDTTLFAERCETLGLPHMVRLLRQYHRASRQTIEAIHAGAAMSDRPAVARLAHRLRSASGSLQFAEMEEMARGLESAAGSEEGDLDAFIAGLRGARRRLFAIAIAEMRVFRDGQLRRSTS